MNWVIKLIDSHKQDAELDPFTIDEAVRIYRPNVKVKKDVNPVSSRNIICGSFWETLLENLTNLRTVCLDINQRTSCFMILTLIPTIRY